MCSSDLRAAWEEEAEERERAKWEPIVADKDAEIADKDAEIAYKNVALADKDTALADKEAIIAQLRAQLTVSG